MHPNSQHIVFAGTHPGVILDRFQRLLVNGVLPAIRTNDATKISFVALTNVEP
jgi:hypothetical protein